MNLNKVFGKNISGKKYIFLLLLLNGNAAQKVKKFLMKIFVFCAVLMLTMPVPFSALIYSKEVIDRSIDRSIKNSY